MARVVLPGLGIEAAGKVGNAFVYTRWKGRTHIKAWKKPRDPKTQWQGRDRTYMSAAGHLTKFVWNSSVLAAQIRGVAPDATPWQAHFVSWMIGSGNELIEASLTAWDTAANSVGWTSVAESLGVQAQHHPQASIDAIEAGEIVFLSARAVYRMGLAAAPADAQDMTSDQIASYAATFEAETFEYVIPPPE